MADSHEIVKLILKKVPVAEGERVIAKLSGIEFEARWKAIQEMHCKCINMIEELQHLKELTDATKVIFWSEVRKLSEQGESSAARGFDLGVRDSDDALVLVEFKHDPVEDVPPIISAIRKFLEERD